MFDREQIEYIQQHGFEALGIYYGTYRGTCTDNEDPEFLGRLKVNVPETYGLETPNIWAWPKGQFAGTGAGFFNIPAKNDVVWVSFEKGNPRHPIWEHGWFGEGDVPLAAKKNLKPTNHVWQSYSGNRIELNDETGEITITNKNGQTIKVANEGIQLNGFTQRAVLGDIAASLLAEFVTELGTIAGVGIAGSVSAPIESSPMWAAFAAKWTTEFEKFKSAKVSLS